jgi:CRISPR-associated protein Cmr1
MPVKPAPNFAPASLAPRDADTAIWHLTLCIITPMMGGGITSQGARKPADLITPIRVASIRGQLRFWWRACNLGGATTVARLRELEASLWGSMSTPSAVTITVTQQPGPPNELPVYVRTMNRWDPIPDMRRIAYGAFPLKPEQGSTDPSGTIHDFGKATFTLCIRSPSAHVSAITEALQAWTQFGGLGGRTRRGFGAIELVVGSLSSGSKAEPLVVPTPENFLDQMRGRPTIPGVPSLANARLAIASRSAFGKPMAAWDAALDKLQHFRQGSNMGRNRAQPGSRSPVGRSLWPEPDEIRRLLNQHARNHGPVHSVHKFPRAAFGLPIIFHFSTAGDPIDSTLNPTGRKRLASPLILRPICKGAQYVPLALVLTQAGLPGLLAFSNDGQPIDPTAAPVQASLELQPKGYTNTTAVVAILNSEEAFKIDPIRTYGGSTSPLDAFLLHFIK